MQPLDQPIPFLVTAGQYGGGMWSVLQQVVAFWLSAGSNLVDLFPDLDHGITESVEEVELVDVIPDDEGKNTPIELF